MKGYLFNILFGFLLFKYKTIYLALPTEFTSHVNTEKYNRIFIY